MASSPILYLTSTLLGNQAQPIQGHHLAQYRLQWKVFPTEKIIPINSCDVKKANNPLVATISALIERGATYTSIIYMGVITDIAPENAVKNAIVTLESPDKTQRFPFEVTEKENLVFHSDTKQYGKLSDLKVGQTVSMQAKCPESKEFKINVVVIR